MRWTRPDLHRPIKVSLVLPIIFLAICVFLVTFPCYVSPLEVGVGMAFIVCGIPVYMITIAWKTKPYWLNKAFNDFNNACAKLFLCVQENEKQ